MAPGLTTAPPAKAIDWADDVDDVDASKGKGPRIQERDEGNGIRVVIEYRTNADGKEVKITRRIKRTLVTTKVNAEVANRKNWTKFGQEQGKKPGPHSATTTVGENAQIKLTAGNTKAEPEPDVDTALRAQLKNKKITCRLCKGDHFTTKCPYKDTLEAAGADGEGADNGLTPATADPTNPAVAASGGAGMLGLGSGGGGKYVPPSMRAGATRGVGERMGGPMGRDEMPTLRVTNLSEYAEEDDLRDMFSRFGRVNRVYVGRDRETNQCRGYAFISFDSKEDADRARIRMDGHGYDNLILSVSWSQPRPDKPA